jgi:hypothetical protein
MTPLHLNEKMLLVTSDFDYRYPLSIPLHLKAQNINNISIVHQQNGQPSSGTQLPIPSSLTGMEILTFHSIVCHVLNSSFPFSPPPFPISYCSPCFPNTKRYLSCSHRPTLHKNNKSFPQFWQSPPSSEFNTRHGLRARNGARSDPRSVFGAYRRHCRGCREWNCY